MKKVLLIIFGVLLCANIKAQVNFTDAIDFDTKDIDGKEVNLFKILEEGKYVLIDFFFTTCGPCQYMAPRVNAAYEAYGCNTGDLYVVGIDHGNTDAQCRLFDEQFGAHYPTVSGVQGGGTGICMNYGIMAYPTIILIAPNKKIVETSLNPFPTGHGLKALFDKYNIEEKDCTTTGVENLGSEDVSFSATPNPSTGNITMHFPTQKNGKVDMDVIDINGKIVKSYKNLTLSNAGIKTFDFSELNKGLYFVKALINDQEVKTTKFLLSE
ncbi:MAG: T9SS type A sorting domain-containing protein [Hyphomicrobiales bacterium]